MDWFETLTGFKEGPYLETQSRFEVAGDRLKSRVNGQSWAIGRFDMVALATLRAQGDGPPAKVDLLRGDVRRLHADPAFAGALFQVASQFNALEMTGPELTPEDGVTRYVSDPTQGPACALAAAPATIYRNYFAPLAGGTGQTRTRQLDGLADIGAFLSARLSRPAAELWTMKNGYALGSASGLKAIGQWLGAAAPEEIDALRGRLCIGLHRDVEVIGSGQLVSQAFASALPVAYSPVAAAIWRPFATLVLEAAYEATLRAAAQTGAGIVALTLLGGGAFGNDIGWILAAIRRALKLAGGGLDVRIVCYSAPPPGLAELIAEF